MAKDDNSSFETKPAEEIRLESIKSLASRYATLTAAEKVKLMQFIRADIGAERDRLANSINELNAVLGESQPPMARPSAARPAPSSTRTVDESMTYNEAILTALKGGEVMGKETLFHRANQLMGGKMKLNTFNATLPLLKKKQKIKSPERGQFQLA